VLSTPSAWIFKSRLKNDDKPKDAYIQSIKMKVSLEPSQIIVSNTVGMIKNELMALALLLFFVLKLSNHV